MRSRAMAFSAAFLCVASLGACGLSLDATPAAEPDGGGTGSSGRSSSSGGASSGATSSSGGASSGATSSSGGSSGVSTSSSGSVPVDASVDATPDGATCPTRVLLDANDGDQLEAACEAQVRCSPAETTTSDYIFGHCANSPCPGWVAVAVGQPVPVEARIDFELINPGFVGLLLHPSGAVTSADASVGALCDQIVAGAGAVVAYYTSEWHLEWVGDSDRCADLLRLYEEDDLNARNKQVSLEVNAGNGMVRATLQENDLLLTLVPNVLPSGTGYDYHFVAFGESDTAKVRAAHLEVCP